MPPWERPPPSALRSMPRETAPTASPADDASRNRPHRQPCGRCLAKPPPPSALRTMPRETAPTVSPAVDASRNRPHRQPCGRCLAKPPPPSALRTMPRETAPTVSPAGCHLPRYGEGGFLESSPHTRLYNVLNLSTYSSKVMIYLMIAEPQYHNTLRLYVFCSNGIILHCIRHIVLRAIQFNCKLCTITIKIYNIMPYRPLTSKVYRTTSKEIIPQMPLFLCHVCPEFSRFQYITFIPSLLHKIPHAISRSKRRPRHGGAVGVAG